mmetsp:Transcript_14485/g.20143  ORF Transcript_14485/g.20143 Transcript_14485/m.20143 type:complete len:83 (-) Transcript_14485:107-355(-)
MEFFREYIPLSSLSSLSLCISRNGKFCALYPTSVVRCGFTQIIVGSILSSLSLLSFSRNIFWDLFDDNLEKRRREVFRDPIL